MQTRLIYIDDSGAAATGRVVYGWIEVLVEDWSSGLDKWLDLRREVFRASKIPPSQELHATKFVNGRGNPSTDAEWNRKKHLRGPVIEAALRAIADCDQLSIGSVHRHTPARGHDYYLQQMDVYEKLVEMWDERSKHRDENVIVFMDGNGSATGYHGGHRALSIGSRRVIEDPSFLAAHRSQWVQMADIVAYSAYMAKFRPPGKEFAHDWYSLLVACDVNGGTLEI